MFEKKFTCVEEAFAIENINDDYKHAKRVGQYKVSERAIYRPDNTYLPVSAVVKLSHDKTSVHVSGCCAGGVPVERLVFTTDNNIYQYIFDTTKDIQKLLAITGLVVM